MEHTQAKRIQTAITSKAEKKLLVWIAERLPKWVSSDMLTFFGTFGAIVIAAGYILSNFDIHWLWLSCLGFFINWFGDSLDGSVARVRNQQRPKYGYYIDHMMDSINEFIMFLGAGFSPLFSLQVTLLVYAAYLMLTLYQSMIVLMKDQFKLTFAKVGPTEFRIIVIIINLVVMYVKPLTALVYAEPKFHTLLGVTYQAGAFEVVGYVIFAIIMVMFFVSFIHDAIDLAKADPKK